MVRIYPSICRRIFENVFKLKGHNLENAESSAESFESLKTDSKLFQILRNLPRKIPCFQYCVVLCETSLRWFSDFTRTTLRIFRVVSKNLELMVNFLSKIHKIPTKIRVFQIVSYQHNNVSNIPPTHGGVYLDHLKQFLVSFKTFEKNSAECSVFSRLCHLR